MDFELDEAAAHRRSVLPSAAILYTSCILVGIFINSSVPIFFELVIETVYPVPEGITCGVVTFLGNLVTGLLLFFLTFYSTGKTRPLRGSGPLINVKVIKSLHPLRNILTVIFLHLVPVKVLITSIRCGVLHIDAGGGDPGRPNPSFHLLVLHPFLRPLLWCVQGIGSLRFLLCFLLLSMKKSLQIPEVCSAFRGSAHPCRFATPPRSLGPHC